MVRVRRHVRLLQHVQLLGLHAAGRRRGGGGRLRGGGLRAGAGREALRHRGVNTNTQVQQVLASGLRCWSRGERSVAPRSRHLINTR